MKSLRDHAEDIDAQSAPSISMLSEAASHHKITIIGGSIPEMSGDKLFYLLCSWSRWWNNSQAQKGKKLFTWHDTNELSVDESVASIFFEVEM